MFLYRCLSVILLLNSTGFLFGCQESNSSKATLSTPLVDGRCDEYAEIGVAPIAISEDVNLYIIENKDYVWISYCFPEGSFGTLDMEIKTETLTDPLNLHISVQLGEWETAKPETAPMVPESDKWWDIEGWTANPIWPNGMDFSEEEPQYQIKNGDAREIQLSKARFGSGKWEIRMKINSIKNSDGKYYNIQFPEDDSYHEFTIK